MPPVAIGFGVLLIVLGVAFYFVTEMKSVTALIPAAFGLVLVVLGLLGRQERLRKHVMHAAAALALVGVIIPLARLWPGIQSGGFDNPNAALETALMGLLCAVFLGLCVRSFVVARRSRSRRALGEEGR